MASRATLSLLPRRGPSTVLQTRPFSQSLVLRAGPNKTSKPAPVRHNPLVGNYTPAAPAPAAAEQRDASVSTEHPNATATPSPDRSPVSSAEVAPNADLPPRPPPPPPSSSSEPANAGSSDTSSALKFPYDATSRHPRNTNPASTPPKRTASIDWLGFLDTRSSIHNQNAANLDPLSRPKVRAAAVTGRTVFVKQYFSENSASSAPQALNVLNKLIKKQGIRNKSHYQKFHERRGLKKKRLRMERWRMQFKKGFRETVRRVMELKRQGW